MRRERERERERETREREREREGWVKSDNITHIHKTPVRRTCSEQTIDRQTDRNKERGRGGRGWARESRRGREEGGGGIGREKGRWYRDKR